MDHYTFLQLEIQEAAFDLLRQHWRIGDPIRALTVGVTRLAPADQVVEQVSFSTWGTRSVNGRKSWRRLLRFCGKSTAREA